MATPLSRQLHLKERMHLNSILALVTLVDHHVHRLLSKPLVRQSLHLQCTAGLSVKSDGPAGFEFSDHVALSNLYWGIKNLELAVQAKTNEDKADRLANSEKMLQIPLLLDEDGSTLGVANSYIVCCTYFYLCLVRKQGGDEWQMTTHFLQSLLASPGAVKTELAPELWKSMFRPQTTDEEARRQARRYKEWLMYFQVVSYGEAPPWDEERMKSFRYRNFGSGRFKHPARELKFTVIQEGKTMNAPNVQDSVKREKMIDHVNYTETKDGKALLTYLGEDFDADIYQGYDTRFLQDMLEESQSDAHADCEDSEI